MDQKKVRVFDALPYQPDGQRAGIARLRKTNVRIDLAVTFRYVNHSRASQIRDAGVKGARCREYRE